ncbi:MAG: hypothetical protein Q7R96_04440 [Nanoarchaeota archaeon]|nr:hypothetical protein [Nanoarchaeota archaeon]
MVSPEALLDQLKASDVFKSWEEQNKKSYLYLFFTITEDVPSVWEVGFFNPKDHTAAAFSVGDEIKLLEGESKVFKPANEMVEQLQLDKVKISFADACAVVERVRAEHYPSEKSHKKIIILQQVKKPIWNITLLTASLNVLNVKLCAKSGDVLEHELRSALSFNQAKQKAS